MLLPQSEEHRHGHTFATYFELSIIKNLVNHILDVKLIVSHKYLNFAVHAQMQMSWCCC